MIEHQVGSTTDCHYPSGWLKVFICWVSITDLALLSTLQLTMLASEKLQLCSARHSLQQQPGIHCGVSADVRIQLLEARQMGR